MGMTSLHTGADSEEKSVMGKLLAHESAKAVLDAVDEDGCTALHYAVYSSRETAIIDLLRAGASTEIADGEGKTPLAVAQALKLGPIAELIKNGPPPLADAEAPA